MRLARFRLQLKKIHHINNPNFQLQRLLVQNRHCCQCLRITGTCHNDIRFTVLIITCLVNDRQSFGTQFHCFMPKDFVTRVHNCKINQKYSILVQEYIQYIERHLEEKFSLNDLADSLGYTDYDMSRRFKKETSVPLSEFIRDKRLERAKFL